METLTSVGLVMIALVRW